MSELSFEQMLDESFKTIHNGEVVEGTVIDVKPEEIILNIGYKADGIITKNEYSNDPSVDLTKVVSADLRREGGELYRNKLFISYYGRRDCFLCRDKQKPFVSFFSKLYEQIAERIFDGIQDQAGVSTSARDRSFGLGDCLFGRF